MSLEEQIGFSSTISITVNEAKMRITLPFPDSRLLPNRKAHWQVKAKATREARHTAKMLAIDWMNTHRKVNFAKVRMTYTFYPKDKRSLADDDSLMPACKPYVDGIVDAGVIPDDSWDVIGERIQRLGGFDKSNPRTEIEIEKGEA